MSSTVIVLGIICLISYSLENEYPERCPKGGRIFERGVPPAIAKQVVDLHNDYRMRIANGSIPTQPRGINIKQMVYDQSLATTTEEVSNACEMEHIWATDPEHRWSWIGQNIYMRSSNKKKIGVQDWDRALKMWFEEERFFRYPNSKVPGSDVSHYTQLVWANSTHIGCDYIFYENLEDSEYPYVKMYTCNYGPGGNYVNRAPYATDDAKWLNVTKNDTKTGEMEIKNKVELQTTSSKNEGNAPTNNDTIISAARNESNSINGGNITSDHGNFAVNGSMFINDNNTISNANFSVSNSNQTDNIGNYSTTISSKNVLDSFNYTVPYTNYTVNIGNTSVPIENHIANNKTIHDKPINNINQTIPNSNITTNNESGVVNHTHSNVGNPTDSGKNSAYSAKSSLCIIILVIVAIQVNNLLSV